MKKLILVILITLGINSSNAQWVTNGPADVSIASLAASGSNIFAGTVYQGIYLSTNNGGSWTTVNTGLANYYVSSFAISGDSIFAGSMDEGIFLSTNNGSNWTMVDSDLIHDYYDDVFALAISGSNIFAGTYGDGVFLSTNHGGSWAMVNTGLTNDTVNALTINGSNIFVGTNGGIFLSTNDGGNWTAINNGLTEMIVRTLLISGSNMFAGTNNGVFLSTNNGNDWTATSLINININSLVTSKSDIFAGSSGNIFLSNDNGNTWTSVKDGLDADVFPLTTSDSTIFAGTFEDGVWQQSLASITGIQQTLATTQTNFTLYPNPANSNLVIQTTTNGKQLLQIFDITGKLLLSQNIYNNKTIIDASSLADGIYAVSLISNNGVANEKLVIVK